MTATNSIGVQAQQFTRPPELFDVTDLDRYDLVIAMDSEVRDTMLSQVQDPAYAEYYSAKVGTLCSFIFIQILVRTGWNVQIEMAKALEVVCRPLPVSVSPKL